MGSWFYDSWFEPCANPKLVRMVRAYRFDFSEFSDANWQTLLAIYRSLPGWKGVGTTQFTQNLPFWFGIQDDLDSEESEEIYLTASVELDILQFDGVLSSEDWIEWTDEFERRAEVLPHRKDL